ncbi:MAG: DUF4167 domain-containing protein [Rhodobacteraceae bacterium]|nr:DUF4167 domain-containing protein [Paracoccaceae bacterium]
MRSSKSRSRSKSNRQRSLGNIVNRVFDSSGPEGKVRGTPQQIIDKYLMLARDAQLGNDRVAEQNFLQHAEHYTRMLGEAQREMAREQEARQGQGEGGQNGGQNGNPNGNQNGNPHGGGQHGNPNGGAERHRQRHDDRGERDAPRSEPEGYAPVEADEGTGLVETPEARAEVQRAAPMMPDLPQPDLAAPAPKKSSRGPRKPREKRDAAPADTAGADAAE